MSPDTNKDELYKRAEALAKTYEESHFTTVRDLVNWIYSEFKQIKYDAERKTHDHCERIAKDKGWIE